MESIKTVPYSSEAESYVLGSILLQNSLASTIVNMLTHNDFYIDKNRNIMLAMTNLYHEGKEIDALSVIEELKRLKLYEASGAEEYILELVDSVPSVANVEVYVDIIREKSIERKLYNTLNELSRDIIDGKTNFKALIEKTEKKVMEVISLRKTSEFVPIYEATKEAINLIENNKNKVGEHLIGIDTGYPKLNEVTYGFQKNQLIILAARPATGKTSLALNFVANACKKSDASVAFFSLEMGIDQLTLRLLSSESGVSMSKLHAGTLSKEEFEYVDIAKTTIDNWKLYLDESTTTDIGEIRAKCRKLSREPGVGLDLVVIDYLQLLSSDRKSRTEEVSQISRELKLLARELKVPVIALSQLSRAVEARQDKRPLLSDLRESGSIEQDADIVMFIHREQQANDDTTKKYRNSRTELIIAKNRQGSTDSVWLMFKSDYSRFDPQKKDE